MAFLDGAVVANTTLHYNTLSLQTGNKCMEEILEFLAYLAIDILFWGLCYGTGRVLTPIFSLGCWKPGKLEKNKKLRKEKRRARAGILVVESEIKYLDADGVAAIGLCFWAILGGLVLVLASFR